MKNIQNAAQNHENAQDSRENLTNVNGQKTWETPSISEISRFSILGGTNAGKAEGITLDGSV